MTPDAECAFAEENGRAVFAVLDDQRLRAHGENLVRGAGQAGFVRQHLGFAVVDEQNVDQLQRLGQLVRVPLIQKFMVSPPVSRTPFISGGPRPAELG